MFLLTILDKGSFDAVMHESLHTTPELAYSYAERIALPQAKARVAEEWRFAIDYRITKLDFIA